MRNRLRVGSLGCLAGSALALTFALTFALSACGGDNPAPQAPSNTAPAPSASSSEPATASSVSAPSSSAPSEGTPAPVASAPAPAAPPAPLPPIFIVAQTAFFAQGDRLGDAVSAAGSDCAKMGAGIDKVAADPAFAASFKKYVEATIRLTPEQRETAKVAYDENQKKFDGMSDAVKTCSANAKVKASMDKLTKVLMTNLKPLLEAFGQPAGASDATKPADASKADASEPSATKPGDATKKK